MNKVQTTRQVVLDMVQEYIDDRGEDGGRPGR